MAEPTKNWCGTIELARRKEAAEIVRRVAEDMGYAAPEEMPRRAADWQADLLKAAELLDPTPPNPSSSAPRPDPPPPR